MLGAGGSDSNALCAKEILDEKGVILQVIKCDPKDIGFPTQRSRIKFVGLHKVRYARLMGWQQLLIEDEEGVTRLITDSVQKWAAKIEDVFKYEHHPTIPLDYFLLDPDHMLLRKLQESLDKKVADKEAGKRKRGACGQRWMSNHKQVYKKHKLEWSDPTLREVAYSQNGHFLQLPDREKDVVLFWDAVEPLPARKDLELGEEQEISTKLSQFNIFPAFCYHQINISILNTNGSFK